MRTMLARLAACCLALGLSGCVVVGSNEPLFGPEDAARVQLRTGLWSAPDEDCPFDPSRPVAAWPSCANPMVVTARAITGGFGKEGAPPETLAYLLAGGRPLVMQIEAPSDRKPGEPRFNFIGVRPTRLDERRRIVEVDAWLVTCTPPSARLPGKQSTTFPGFVMSPGDGFCLATRPGPVRHAAKRLEELKIHGQDLGLHARWMREPDR